MTRKELGARGEQAARAFLERAGMTIVDTNWRTKAGEIDIIALDGPDLVFVEVKTRRSLSAGLPEEAISSAKRRRITKLALEYAARAGVEPRVRFDVIALTVIAEDRALLRHHRAAFVSGE